MGRSMLLCLLFCLTAANLLNTRFPESYTAIISTTGQGQTFNSTLASNGKMTASLTPILGENMRTFQYKENMTTYTIGVPGLDKDKCSGLYSLPTDPVLDFFAEANKKAKLIGKCRTGIFSFGLLWQYAVTDSVTEICTNLLASEPVWAKTNVTNGGQTVSAESKFISFSAKVDDSLFTLPSTCYLVVNSRKHLLKIPSVWYVSLDHTRPEPVVKGDNITWTNVTTHHMAIQDAQGRNVMIEGYSVYDVNSEEGKSWSMFFPENKTMYRGFKDSKNCSCLRDTISSADPTVAVYNASNKDVRGIEAVYTGVPCEITSTGVVFGYWYNGILPDIKYCIRFDATEPLRIEIGSETWTYANFQGDKDVSGVIQLPERCWNITCNL